MNAGRRWIAIVIGLLLGNVLAGVVLITAAHHGASRVLPDYYEQGVHYDDAIDQAQRNRLLAWQVGVSIDRGIATVTATDMNGNPLDRARVRIDGIERSDAALVIAGDLIATAPGQYRARVGGTGWIDVSVTIDRGTDRYAHRLALEAR
jgi:nitrogen fixation protein FixH